jgi:quercetin dioxygenase-like cupin family protein
MQITRSSIDTQKGPADWFTGDVYIDAVAAPAASSTFAAAAVHFTPGARTAWHTHPHGQTIFVTEGVGLCQREGGPVEIIRPGDRVFFEPKENHWHGAAPNRFMVHIAIAERALGEAVDRARLVDQPLATGDVGVSRDVAR